MVWWVVIVLAAVYLTLRMVQMTYWFVTRFLLAPAIPWPLKAVTLLAMAGMALGARLWWKRRFGKPRASRPQA
ncbi:MAG: hypothetical protein Q7K03_01395 [Dehalococcoidia bacterium]|nr:hypothetical protein [Dehalococcoidia bacterium]